MKIETPAIIEKKLEEIEKLAAVGNAVSAFIEACRLNGMNPEDMGELITSMAARRMRKELPAFKRK